MKCHRLFKRIEELRDEYIQFWIDICKIESPTEYKEGVDRVGEYIMNKARERGWNIEIQEQPVSGDCICITMNPEAAGGAVCFSAHMDTVHPIGLFGEEVVRCDAEKIYGPGVIDCKGGIAASFYAMASLEDCGFKSRPIKLILQSDEETSSRGSNKTTIDFMCEKAAGAIAFFNNEGMSYNKKPYVTVSRKGILRYKFTVHGKACHASTCYDGASAIREAAHKIIELEKFKEPDGLTCNCGLICGGTAENSVAAECNFTADIRFKDTEQMKFAQKTVDDIAKKSFVDGTSCDVTLVSERCAMELTERNLELLKKVNDINLENDLPILNAEHGKGGSDAAYITAAGIPCLDSFGVVGGCYHSKDEFAYLDSLVSGAKMLAATAYCL